MAGVDVQFKPTLQSSCDYRFFFLLFVIFEFGILFLKSALNHSINQFILIDLILNVLKLHMS